MSTGIWTLRSVTSSKQILLKSCGWTYETLDEAHKAPDENQRGFKISRDVSARTLRLDLIEQGVLVGRMSDVQGPENRGPHLSGAQTPIRSAWHAQRADRPQTEGAIWGARAPLQRLGGRASPHSLLWLVGKWVFSIKCYPRRESTNGELGSQGGLSKQTENQKSRAQGQGSHQGPASVDLTSLLTLGAGGWGKTGGGQSTNTGPAPNPHHPLSNLWHPKTEQGWGYAAEWGPSLLYWPKLNFHVASFKRLPAWQIKSSSVKGHFYVLETEVPTDSSFRSQTGPPSSLHPSHNAAVRAILLACKYAPVTWPFGIV